MRTQSDRLRTSAHINRIFAKKAATGSEDTTESPDFYRGRAEAYVEAATFLGSVDPT